MIVQVAIFFLSIEKTILWSRGYGPLSCSPFSGDYGMLEMVKFLEAKLLAARLSLGKSVMTL
jgi:hypothetical protein